MPEPQSPRSVEIPFVLEQVKPGNILNIGGTEGSDWKWKLCDKQPMTIVDIRELPQKHRNLTMVRGDIRKITPEDIGLFDNIILMSTLEHIALSGYSPDGTNKATWKNSPRSEQLKVFKHCMKFLKPNGKMIFTVPCGIPIANPPRKLHYNEEMLSDLKDGYKVLSELYYKRPKLGWVKCGKLPTELFTLKEEEHMQINNAITRSVILMTLTNK